MPLLHPAGGTVDVNRSLEGVDGFGLLIDAIDQFLLGRLLQRSLRITVFDRTRPEQTAGGGQDCQEYDYGPKGRATPHEYMNTPQLFEYTSAKRVQNPHALLSRDYSLDTVAKQLISRILRSSDMSSFCTHPYLPTKGRITIVRSEG